MVMLLPRQSPFNVVSSLSLHLFSSFQDQRAFCGFFFASCFLTSFDWVGGIFPLFVENLQCASCTTKADRCGLGGCVFFVFFSGSF